LSVASKPDAVAYLHAPADELHKRIMERGRPYEADVSMRYIHRLSERRRRLFRDWDRCPVIEVDTSLTDLREPGQISQLAMQITVAVKSSA
jgi:deoxyadenosine/deoxycytidine kinase